MNTVADLVRAAGDPAVRRIVVTGEIRGAPAFGLGPGQHLVGTGDGAAVVFADGTDGVRLSRDNEVANLALRAAPAHRVLHQDSTVDSLGTVRLAGLTVTGQVQIVARDRVHTGHVVVDGLDVVAADTRARADRPALLGVGVLQGAFTLWNAHPDPAVVLTADLRGINAGRPDGPVRGSGVFVAGVPEGGRLDVDPLETGPVYTDGGLPEGTSDTISGGVFVVHGAHVRLVRNHGPVTTRGVNDMALDNWGTVDTWIAAAPLTTYGRSGVGFVNFGAIGVLRVQAPVETHGVGARGFNVYRLDGHTGPTVETVEFDRIVTHADAAIGVQIGQPIGNLVVHDGIRTYGGSGDSLVRGVIKRLSAHALSVQPGGRVERVTVGGSLASAGAGVTAVEVLGEVAEMRVAGGIRAEGAGADGLRVAGMLVLHDTDVTARDGAALRVGVVR